MEELSLIQGLFVFLGDERSVANNFLVSRPTVDTAIAKITLSSRSTKRKVSFPVPYVAPLQQTGVVQSWEMKRRSQQL